MHIVQMRRSIIQQRKQATRILFLGIEPFVQILWAQRDHTPIMTSGRSLWRWIVRDESKRQQVVLARCSPPRPQARQQQLLGWFGLELHHYHSRLLTGPELTPFGMVQQHVLVKGVCHQHAVGVPELLSPEPVEVVSARVVGTRETDVIRSGLASRTTLVAHG